MSGYPFGGYGPPPPQAPGGGYFPPNTQPLTTVPPFVASYSQGPIPPVPPPGTFPPPHPSYGYPMQPPTGFAFTPPQQSVPPQQFSGFAGPSGPSQVSPPDSASVPPQPTTSAPTTSAPGIASLPPAASQQFGQGAPPGYQYQYSMCTGMRKALLIGINYFGQRGQLRGCINDVRNMSGYLVSHFGYKREDMVILTDDQQNPISQPTKQNILRAMHWLVKDAKPNDSLFFHYSGHGGQTKDLEGDEADGYDEVIYPVDFRQTSHITDDEMHRIMVQPLPAGVRLTAIFDSCHSATALDLPYVYSTQGMIKEPNLAREAGQGLLNVVSACARNDLDAAGDSIVSVFKKAATGEAQHQRSLLTKTSAADVVMFSGSKDNQTSADTMVSSQATGAMSWAFISALRKNPQQSYVQLLNSIRDELETRYTQRPQLSCSHPLSASKILIAGA